MRGRIGPLGWGMLVAVTLAQLLAVSRSISPASLRTAEPFYTDDHALHFARAALIAEELPRTGRLWAWDPGTMAGWPAGASVFDLDNVGTSVAVALLAPLGPARAYKLTVWLCLVLAPAVVWSAARRLGAAPDEALGATAAAVVVGAAAFTVRLGMFANFAVAYLAGLVVVLAARHLAAPRLGSLVALLATAIVGLYLHVFLGILVLVPCGVLVVGHALRAPGRTLTQGLLITIALVALCAPWLAPFLRFAPMLGWDYPHHFFQTGPLTHAWQPLVVLGAWPLLLLVAAVIGFAHWWPRAEGPLAAAWGLWVVVLLLGALQGSRIPLIARLEPAHLMVPLSFALCPLAGIGVAAVVRGTLRRLGRPARAASVLVPLVFLPHLALALVRLAPLPPIRATLPPEAHALLAWLRQHTDPGARVLVEDRAHLERPRLDRDVPDHPWFGSHLPALLPRLIDREILGGPYPEMPIAPHAAGLASGRFFGAPIGTWTAAALAGQLERYNVGWLVVWSDVVRAHLIAHPTVAAHLADLGDFTVFRTRHPPSFIEQGRATVAAHPNALVVTDAAPGRLVLRYHWYPGMCTVPPLPIGPAPVPGGAMPFVAVEVQGTRRFTVHPTTGWRGRCG